MLMVTFSFILGAYVSISACGTETSEGVEQPDTTSLPTDSTPAGDDDAGASSDTGTSDGARDG